MKTTAIVLGMLAAALIIAGGAAFSGKGPDSEIFGIVLMLFGAGPGVPAVILAVKGDMKKPGS